MVKGTVAVSTAGKKTQSYRRCKVSVNMLHGLDIVKMSEAVLSLNYALYRITKYLSHATIISHYVHMIAIIRY